MKKLIVLLSLVPLIAVAQEPLSLKEFRRRTVNYNLQLKMAGEQSFAASEKIKIAKTGFLPSLEAVANGNYQIGNKISFGTMVIKDYNYNANVTLQENVWAGGAIRAQYESAKIENTISKEAERQTLENVIYASDVTYWAFAASVEQVEVMNEYLDIVTSLYKVVGERFADGYVSKTDLLMVETRLNEANIQKIAAEKLYHNSVQGLNTMLGQHKVSEYALVDSVTHITALPKFATLETALDNRAEYGIATMNVELQNQNVKLARSQFNPTFAVGIQGVFGTQALNFTGDPKFYGVAFAQFNVPIFNWGERRHTVSMAKSGVRSMEYSKSDVADRISDELGTARIGLEQGFLQTQVAKKNLEIANENLALNTFSYQEGKLPILDVLQSQLAWIQSFTSYVNSNYQYRVAYAEYEKAVGGKKLD